MLKTGRGRFIIFHLSTLRIISDGTLKYVKIASFPISTTHYNNYPHIPVTLHDI